MKDILSQLTKKKNLLDGYSPISDEVIKNLDEWFRIELTYSSNAIEGNTLTRQETAIVVEEGTTIEGKSIQEHLEAINHAQAYDFIQKNLIHKRKEAVTQKDVLDVHAMILQKINDAHAGRYRSTAVRIRGSQTILPNPLKVPELMGEFIDWLHAANTDHIAQIAADVHYKIVTIHPFVDGNGRTARLMMNLILMTEGYPPAIIRKEERSAYINALEKGQTGGPLDDYYRIIYEAVDRSLDIYLESIQPEKEVVPSSKKRFYTTQEVATLLQVDPETVRRYVRDGKLKAVKLGGKFIRIDKKDLDEFIEGMK